MKNIIISAGGTGGHISPGVALLEYILANQESFQIEKAYLHCPLRNQDNPDLKNKNFHILWHQLHQPKSKVFLFSLFLSSLKTFLLFRKLKIESIIAMGGYSSLPSILYAILFKKDLFLCEQNCIMGKTTKFFSFFSKKIALSFPVVPSVKSQNSKILGNPIRQKIIQKKEKKDTYDKIRVLVLGGSQGARQINHIISKIYSLKEIAHNFKFYLITGNSLFEETKKMINLNENIEIIDYTNEIQKYYIKTDLVIARAGAGIISECLFYNLPMILIPYPYAKDNHQSINAQYVMKTKTGFVIEQKNTDTGPILEILYKIKKNKNLLKELSLNCENFSIKNSAKNIVQYFFS